MYGLAVMQTISNSTIINHISLLVVLDTYFRSFFISPFSHLFLYFLTWKIFDKVKKLRKWVEKTQKVVLTLTTLNMNNSLTELNVALHSLFCYLISVSKL